MTLTRYYCCFDEKQQNYQLITCKQFPKKKWKSMIPLDLPLENVANQDQFLEKALQKELEKLKKEVFFQRFWQLADHKTQRSLLLSIYLRQKYPKGVFNVEIDNWLSTGPFAQIHQENKKLLQNFKPRQILARFISTSGNHKKSLRIGHIHLAYDRIKGQDIFSIHFDKHNPNHLKGLGLLKHFLFEDGKNKNLLKVFNKQNC
jgi:hypothetical protein